MLSCYWPNPVISYILSIFSFLVLAPLIINLHSPIYKNEVIARIGSNRNTFFKAWKNLEKYDIVKPYKRVGKAMLYVLNRENKLVKWLIKLDWALVEKSIDELKIPVAVKTRK